MPKAIVRPPGQGLSKKARRRRARQGAANGAPKNRRANGGGAPYQGPLPSGANKLMRQQFRSTGQMMSAPAAMARASRQNAPRMAMSSNGQVCVVTHREYVAEVPGAAAWTTTAYVIQPALQALFNWLASIAGNFEKYRFRRLRFCYETESATSQAGSVVLAIDYDAVDAAPASKQAALSYKSSVRSAPWQECCLDCDLSVDAQRDLLYTRSGAVPSGSDQKLYDLGQLFVGVQNSAGATGELWVEYTIELHTPQQSVSSTNPISSKSTGTTSLTATALVGADAAFATGSNAGWALTSASTMTCTIAGDYLFVNRLAGTTIVNGSSTMGGTATTTVLGRVVDAAAAIAISMNAVRAQVGQTIVPTIDSAAALTSSVWRIATYQYGLA